MSTTTPNKTSATTLLTHTLVATADMVVGSAIDVSGKYSARYFIAMGRTVATALTNEVLFRLEASAKTSGDDEWYPIFSFTSQYGKTASSSTTVNDASFNAADTTFVVTSATGITAGDTLYLYESGTIANSEFTRVKSMSGTTVTLEQAITRNHTNGIAVSDLAEKFSGDIDLSNIARMRLVVDTATNASGQSVGILAYLTTFDSLTTA